MLTPKTKHLFLVLLLKDGPLLNLAETLLRSTGREVMVAQLQARYEHMIQKVRAVLLPVPITGRGKTPGVVKITFLKSSMVLANDGKGTNILKEFPAASYLIVPETVTPKEEENQFSYLSQEIALAKKEDTESLVFFEEGSVLGLHTQTMQEEKTEHDSDIISYIAQTIEKVDTFLLSFYESIW